MNRGSWLGVAAVALVVVAGCGGSARGGRAAAHTSTPSAHAVHIVALGDSDATGIGDSTGRGWVGRYGDLVKGQLNLPVTVDNLATEGATSDQLRVSVTTDDALRRLLSSADVILIGVGGADLNAGDDALSAGQCTGRQCYAGILRTFAANIEAIATEVRHLAPSALLRAMSLPDGFPGAGSAFPPFATADVSRYQVTEERAAVCHAMQSSGGRCIDVVRAFNGAKGTADAYASGLMTKNPCCYPSSDGQQLIARLLLATGLSGLRVTS